MPRRKDNEFRIGFAQGPAPSAWGVLVWETPDGMNAAKAQAIMKDFVASTGGLYELCTELNIPTATAQIYLTNACQIPKGVAWKLPRLKARIKLGAAQAQADISRYLPKEPEPIKSFVTLNTEAGRRAAQLFSRSRAVSKIPLMKAAKIAKVTPEVLSKQEASQITPKAKAFFPLCELYKIRPESFGFVGAMETIIKSWRMKQATDDKKITK